MTERLDKWLWHARFYRTRTLATAMVRTGRVRLNGQVTKKPATPVAAGDVLTIVQPGRVRVIEVCKPAERRGSASEAALLYRDRDDVAARVAAGPTED